MRSINSTFLLFIVLVFGFQNSKASNKKQSKPNIIFIFADDWGFGDLGCHGHPELRTPVLDKLAEEGTDFHHFTVNGSTCSPSRTAVMTGHFPTRHGVRRFYPAVKEKVEDWNMPPWLDPKEVLLPRLLQQAGYKTAHYGKWHLGSPAFLEAPLPEEYGYDDSDCYSKVGTSLGYEDEHSSKWTPKAVDKTIEFINKNKDQPFFVNLWIHESHTPIEPTEEHKAVYSNIDDPNKTYYAVITEADRQIGRVVSALEELGLDENTMIIFSSDNGPEFPAEGIKGGRLFSRGSTAGRRGQKRSLMQGGISVPFIVRWPAKIPAGKLDNNSVITAVDLLPTFCHLAGAELPKGYEGDGENMADALFGKKFVRQKEILWDWRGGRRGPDWWADLGIRQGDFKLLGTKDGKRFELYDLTKDPFEKDEISGKHSDIFEEMKSKMMEWGEFAHQ